MAAPIVGENSIGIRFPWRSFQAPIRRSASSSSWASVARRLTAAPWAVEELDACFVVAPITENEFS
jgi:hypothetical protein